MSANYINVSEQITLEGGIPVQVSALYWPQDDKVTNVLARIGEENPDDEDGLWTVHVDGDRKLFGDGDLISGVLFTKHEDQIQQAAFDAAETVEA